MLLTTCSPTTFEIWLNYQEGYYGLLEYHNGSWEILFYYGSATSHFFLITQRFDNRNGRSIGDSGYGSNARLYGCDPIKSYCVYGKCDDRCLTRYSGMEENMNELTMNCRSWKMLSIRLKLSHVMSARSQFSPLSLAIRV